MYHIIFMMFQDTSLVLTFTIKNIQIRVKQIFSVNQYIKHSVSQHKKTSTAKYEIN